jgi:hypothetical protein
MSKLLHPGNSWKLLKKEAMRLFLLWYSCLGEQAGDEVNRESDSDMRFLSVNLHSQTALLSAFASIFGFIDYSTVLRKGADPL